MNRNTSLVRKVTYVTIIVLLLFPLYYLGQPQSRDESGQATGGGKLAGLRDKYSLAQGELGDIDPTSETMKLATLGLRPVAVVILWHKADEYKKKENWDAFSATTNQITKLQPNFLKVWEFQSHNLAYNISVEFDNYRHRYHWVKKGIDFLIEGTRQNRDEPFLQGTIGWNLSRKIGYADERAQFRRMFRVDHDYHAEMRNHVDIESSDVQGPDGRPDHWLVGWLWYLEATKSIDLKGKSLRQQSPVVFHSHAPLCWVYYAINAEKDGFLDEKAEIAWRRAADEIRKYGERDIPSSWGHPVRLGSMKILQEEKKQWAEKLSKLTPGAHEAIEKEKLAALSPEERKVLDTPEAQRTPEQWHVWMQIPAKLTYSQFEVAVRAAEEDRDTAKLIAEKITDLDARISHTDHYRNQQNYPYWQTRCEVEQKPIAVQARRNVFKAEEYFQSADLVNSRESFEAAWEDWASIFQEYPDLIHDEMGEDLGSPIAKYAEVLRQLDKSFPTDFKLQEIKDHYEAKKFGKPLPQKKPPTSSLIDDVLKSLKTDTTDDAKPDEPAKEGETPKKDSDEKPANKNDTPSNDSAAKEEAAKPKDEVKPADEAGKPQEKTPVPESPKPDAP